MIFDTVGRGRPIAPSIPSAAAESMVVSTPADDGAVCVPLSPARDRVVDEPALLVICPCAVALCPLVAIFD